MFISTTRFHITNHTTPAPQGHDEEQSGKNEKGVLGRGITRTTRVSFLACQQLDSRSFLPQERWETSTAASIQKPRAQLLISRRIRQCTFEACASAVMHRGYLAVACTDTFGIDGCAIGLLAFRTIEKVSIVYKPMISLLLLRRLVAEILMR